MQLTAGEVGWKMEGRLGTTYNAVVGTRGGGRWGEDVCTATADVSTTSNEVL